MTVMIILFVILFIPVCTKAQEQASLTMHKAVAQALAHRPDLDALRYVVQAQRSLAKAEISGYLPTIVLGSDISKQNGQKTLGSSTSVAANQLIYSFAGPLQRYQQAKNLTEISELDRAIMANMIRLETEKAFLQTWLIQEQNEAIQALTKSTETTFKRQDRRNDLGQRNKEEWLQDVEDNATNEGRIDEYYDNTQIVYKRLEFLMGQSLELLPSDDTMEQFYQPHVTLAWQCKDTYHLRPLALCQEDALTFRPEIPQGLKRVAVQKWNVKIAQGLRLPTIAATAEAGCVVTPANTISTSPTDFGEVISVNRSNYPTIDSFWSIGVCFRWPLFDGLVTQYQQQQAQAIKVKEMLDNDQTLLRIKQEVHEKYFELAKAIKQLKTQKANYERNQNAFSLMEQKQALGKASDADFDAAQTAWNQAQLDWLARNVVVAQAERDLAYACGYPENLA